MTSYLPYNIHHAKYLTGGMSSYTSYQRKHLRGPAGVRPRLTFKVLDKVAKSRLQPRALSFKLDFTNQPSYINIVTFFDLQIRGYLRRSQQTAK
jgi:hypothetical protein